MVNMPKSSDFAILFKKYRLRSEIETLAGFADLLAEEGYVYENSLFTRWQTGEERLRISNNFHLRKQTLPDEIDIFVGREHIIKDTVWHLINKKKIILYGPPGIGKTAMGIKIAHLLKDQFTDGVFWFRADLKNQDYILDELLVYLGFDAKSLNSTELKVKKLTETAKLPTHAYKGDLGYDLYADEDKLIVGGGSASIKTGIAIQFPTGWGGFIKDRSSIAKLSVGSLGGVIDFGYSGEINIMLVNHSLFNSYKITKGDKIAQLVPIPVTDWEIEEVDSLEKRERAENGFGSTGK